MSTLYRPTKNPWEAGSLWAWLGVCFALGFVLRCYVTGVPDPDVDEVLRFYFAKFGYGWALFKELYHSEVHPPGFYLVLRLWETILGFRLEAPEDKLQWVYFLNAVGFLLSAPFMLTLLTELTSSFRAKFVFIFLYCANDFFIGMARQLRPYAWWGTWVFLSLTACLKALRTGTRRDLWIWVLAASGMFWLHFLSVYMIPIQLFFLGRAHKKKLVGPGLGLIIACLPAAAVMFNLDKLAHLHPLTFTKVFSFSLGMELIHDVLYPALHLGTVSWREPIFITLVYLVLLWVLVRREMPAAFSLCVATLILPGLLFLRSALLKDPIYLSRHFYFVHIHLFIVFFLILERSDRRRDLFSRFVTLPLVGLMVLSSIQNILGYYRHNPPLAELLTRKVSLISDRFQYVKELEADELIPKAICARIARFSDDYALMEVTFHLCPEVFATLNRMQTQIYPPNQEWFDAKHAPLVYVYHDDIPSKNLYCNPKHYLGIWSGKPAKAFLEYYVVDRVSGDYLYWVEKEERKKLLQEPTLKPKV